MKKKTITINYLDLTKVIDTLKAKGLLTKIEVSVDTLTISLLEKAVELGSRFLKTDL